MQVKPIPVSSGGSNLDQRDARDRADKYQEPPQTGDEGAIAQQAPYRYEQPGCDDCPYQGVQKDDHGVEDIGLRKCKQVSG